MSKGDMDYLSVEISPLMRAAVVDNASEMQWAVDVITLSNSRRWGNQDLFEAKRTACVDKVKQLPLTLQIVKKTKRPPIPEILD